VLKDASIQATNSIAFTIDTIVAMFALADLGDGGVTDDFPVSDVWDLRVKDSP
jgi:hypothetical protein